METLDDNLLFRWFVGLDWDAPVGDGTVFTKNRDRLLGGDVAMAFFQQMRAQAKAHRRLSDEPFTVEGTLLDAWAGQKSFKKKAEPAAPPDDPGNPSLDFRGDRRPNATHVSTTDPEARLYKKAAGQEATLGFLGHGTPCRARGGSLWGGTQIMTPLISSRRCGCGRSLPMLPRTRRGGRVPWMAAPPGIPATCQSTEAQAGRRDFWLAENGRAAPQGQAPWRARVGWLFTLRRPSTPWCGCAIS